MRYNPEINKDTPKPKAVNAVMNCMPTRIAIEYAHKRLLRIAHTIETPKQDDDTQYAFISQKKYRFVQKSTYKLHMQKTKSPQKKRIIQSSKAYNLKEYKKIKRENIKSKLKRFKAHLLKKLVKHKNSTKGNPKL